VISAREILHFWQIWPRVSWTFCFLFSAKDEGHMFEITRVRRRKKRTCEEGTCRTCEEIGSYRSHKCGTEQVHTTTRVTVVHSHTWGSPHM
jgi:hypothetical protein